MTQQIIEPGKAYTTTQAGYFLGFTENYIRRLIRHGRIIATKPTGGHHRITGEEIQRILDGLQGQGRVPAIRIDEPADVIFVTEEQAARIFGGPPNTSMDLSEQPTEEEGDGSIYDYMVRKFGE
jgi:excisionase family DNA binding protein